MHVVLLSAEYPPLPGGIGDYTRRLALALREGGVDVTVLTSAEATGVPGDPLEVVPLVRRWGWRSLSAVARYLRAHPADVVNLQYQTGAYRMHPAIHFLPGSLGLLPKPPALVVTMHDLRLPYLFPKAGRLRQAIVTDLLARAAAVIVTNGADFARLSGSGARMTDVLNPLPPGSLRRLQLIPLGSNLPTSLPGYDRVAWRARLEIAPGEALLGYFGLLHPTKGADLLVEALAQLLRAGRPVRLLMVGGGTGVTDPGSAAYAAEVHAQIDRLGLADLVRWTGACPAEEAAGHLLACDLVVLPYRDGASFRRSSLVAALALGCPVVTTEPLSGDEVSLGPGEPTLASGENAALAPREDAAALAASIAALLDDPMRRRQLGEGARRLGEAFRWEEVAERVERLGTLVGR